MTHGITHIGLFVIFGIVMLPVYAMVAGWLLGEPREYRPVALAVGFMIGFTFLIVLSLGVVGLMTWLVTPF